MKALSVLMWVLAATVIAVLMVGLGDTVSEESVAVPKSGEIQTYQLVDPGGGLVDTLQLRWTGDAVDVESSNDASWVSPSQRSNKLYVDSDWHARLTWVEEDPYHAYIEVELVEGPALLWRLMPDEPIGGR